MPVFRRPPFPPGGGPAPFRAAASHLRAAGSDHVWTKSSASLKRMGLPHLKKITRHQNRPSLSCAMSPPQRPSFKEVFQLIDLKLSYQDRIDTVLSGMMAHTIVICEQEGILHPGQSEKIGIEPGASPIQSKATLQAELKMSGSPTNS